MHGSVRTSLQHMYSVFCFDSVFTCGVSMKVSPVLPLFLVASASAVLSAVFSVVCEECKS